MKYSYPNRIITITINFNPSFHFHRKFNKIDMFLLIKLNKNFDQLNAMIRILISFHIIYYWQNGI